jgi:SPOR domain
VEPLPSELRCRTCGAPCERGQEYCLACGNRLRPPRRAPGLAVWLVPSGAALLVAAGGTAGAIAATNDTDHHGATAIVAVSPLRPAPAPPTPKTTGPTKKANTAGGLISWPSTNGYTIVLASLPLSGGVAPARARARAALRAGLRHVGILVSSTYPSLQPGYYMVFSGVYASEEEAQADLTAARDAFPSASARPVVR